MYCWICYYPGRVNKGSSISNMIEHYTTKHDSVRQQLLILNQTDATSDMMKRPIESAQKTLFESVKIHF